MLSMTGIEMLDENEGTTGICRKRRKQLPHSLEPAGRRAEAHYRKCDILR